MIIVLKPGTKEAEIEHVKEEIGKHGWKPMLFEGK